MEIEIDGQGAQPLFDAINAAPFSPQFRESFISEILTTPGLRFGGPGIEGLFDCANVSAARGDAGNFIARTRLSPAGELMTAALRALTIGAEAVKLEDI